MRLVKTLPYLLSLSAALGSASAWSLPNDREQPVRIQADSAQMDDKNKVATYTGDVIITQGSMMIKGNVVTVTLNQAGDIDTATSVGNLAYFEQQQDAAKPDKMQGYAKQIQYQAGKDLIILTDQARVINAGNTTEGEKIVYNSKTQVATAGRGGKDIKTPRQRIDMVIQPKKKAE
ncbi:lipopolysaccharide transport periplasmic protein LptA [Pseudomonas sp. 148P]|jgi:lipopolysaccharide export system protein LptA|uniref:Lipopolysaccharide export system protein LptA n=1 Tax=Pseudomonas ulcerans TaxID=3115852 RepID=A0ABU7HRB8_9PSED|nr:MULTISPECIES: lipopolysaccharide transport periplasmic protein LptA [unclassified Pseudomonas]MDR0276795.1 lipopolysaccharide transport periplasmic protein LptA [Paucimonas sp.]MEE1923109.1 lipopolysaccharide transport periplasmic protein LptA [Pseudomonas sp. 147P]MEE1934071.1 lipopolysaccharide transport periplasmic protein LptA [Pseudomonas sp. 148P]